MEGEICKYIGCDNLQSKWGNICVSCSNKYSGKEKPPVKEFYVRGHNKGKPRGTPTKNIEVGLSSFKKLFKSEIERLRFNKPDPIHPEENLWAEQEDDGFKTYKRFQPSLDDTVGDVGKNYPWLSK